ncbi:MAG: thioether cross-link-forming SCIFF peptide maturase [Clostridia bacterium]|nr:thioether cross-link-forming SCIFF peptide maturase [Clostridia bacterium]
MIHQFKLNGYNIVLDVYSGSVHVVDEVAYDLIAGYENTPQETLIAEIGEKYPSVAREEIEECLSDIEALREDGRLFSEDAYRDRAFDFKARNTSVKALCLHVAHTCNLNCEYCFAAQGKFHGKEALMSFETGKAALDFLVRNSGRHVNLEVDFFGGEPLMNFDVVKQLVAYARSIEKDAGKNFRFTLTTNGMNIDDEVIEFANRECHNVVLSLDGRKEIHDASRSDYRGVGSYDRIVPKFQKLVKARGNKGYYMRGTFTHKNPDFTKDLFHMADLGFTELSMEPVVSPAGTPWALTEEDLPVILEQYEILAEEMLRREQEGRPITFYHYMLDLSHGPCIYKRIAGCGSGTEYFAVTPTGELYPCHQFVGDERYRMGDVWQGITNEALRDDFKLCNVYARPECADCWAKLFCSGGCAANAYHATGSIRGVYDYGCRLFRKRIECALMLKAAEDELGLGEGNTDGAGTAEQDCAEGCETCADEIFGGDCSADCPAADARTGADCGECPSDPGADQA